MADVTSTSSYDGKGNVVLYGASATSDGAGAVTMSLNTGGRPNAIAMASINLSFVAEVESYFRYYTLRASTLSAPDKPTTYPPSASWTDTEPTYDPEVDNSLYFVDLAVFTDGSWLYSDVSLSTSFQAAKEANDKVDTTAEELRIAISEEHASIIEDASAITMETLKSYTTVDEFETYRDSTDSQLQLMNDQFSVRLTQTTEQITTANDSLQSQINTVTSYMNFTAEDGLVLGKTDDPAKMQLQNDEFNILMNGNVVQTFNADGYGETPELHVTRSFTLLGYKFERDQHGNINCEYVG